MSRRRRTKTHRSRAVAAIVEKASGSLERKVTEAVIIQKLKPDLNGQVDIVVFFYLITFTSIIIEPIV